MKPLGINSRRDHTESRAVSLIDIALRKLAPEWNPTDRYSAFLRLQKAKMEGEILTGLLYIDPESKELHDLIETTERPLNTLREKDLCPGNAALQEINAGLR